MAMLSPKQLGKKAAENEWGSGPMPGFWSWQEKLSAEEWAEARNSYDKRTAELNQHQEDPEEVLVPDAEREVVLDPAEYDQP